MDARLVSDKLVAIIARPLPLLGLRVRDSLKLGVISLMALLTLPFLFLGNDDVYRRISGMMNYAAPKSISLRTAEGMFFCRGYDDFFILWPGYEAELAHFLILARGSVAIDVGAHVGRYAVILANRAKRVIAVEPNSANFQMLRKNIELNNLQNVDALRVACWDRPLHTMRLYLSPSPGKHSFLHPQARFEEVETVTLDDILENLRIEPSEVGLVKVDAEGAEPGILKGARRLLSLGSPRVLFEAFPQTEQEAIDALHSYGYSKISRVGEINFVADK